MKRTSNESQVQSLLADFVQGASYLPELGSTSLAAKESGIKKEEFLHFFVDFQ